MHLHRSGSGLLFSSALIAGVLCLSACNRGADKTAKGAMPQAFPVKVQKAELKPVGEFSDYLATLKSRNSSTLQPQVAGQITRIFVKSGEAVRAGQPLLEIDPHKQEATLHSQEATRLSKIATMQLNKKELERQEKLYAAGVISRQSLDQAQSAYDFSKADLASSAASVREQQVQLRYYKVTAPTKGVIGDIPVRVGDYITTSTVLTTLDQSGRLEAYISVPSEKASEVHMGLPVEIVSDSGVPPVKTAVDFISPRIDPDNQLLLIKANIPNAGGRFRNDQVVHVRVVWNQNPHPLIPVTAVSRLNGQAFAFIAEPGQHGFVAHQRLLQLGDVVGNDYIVLDGIKPGDTVILTGVQMLVDGMPVQPQPQS